MVSLATDAASHEITLRLNASTYREEGGTKLIKVHCMNQYDESNMVEPTGTTEYWEERCDLVGPMGVFLGPLGGILGGSGSL